MIEYTIPSFIMKFYGRCALINSFQVYSTLGKKAVKKYGKIRITVNGNITVM